MGVSGDKLLRSLFWIYFSAMLIGTAILTLQNMLVLGISFADLLEFNLKAVMLGDLIILLILLFVSALRLRKVRAFISGRAADGSKAEVLSRLHRFPAEIFWGMLLLSVLFSLLFHLSENLYYGDTPFFLTGEGFVSYLENLLMEMTLALTLAVLFFTMTRRSLRPHVLKIEAMHLNGREKTTFVRPMLITFISCFLIALLTLVRYVFERLSAGSPLELHVLFGLAGFYFLFGLAVFSLLVFDFRRELVVLIHGMLSLTEGDREKLHQRMPLMSLDETGQLGEAFNLLQEHMTKEYEELDKQIKLAYNVQQRLLPSSRQRWGPLEICAVCEQMQEVGGDLYDVVPLDDERLAVICGDVSGKGISAALMMSAAMVLFRTEIRREGSAARVLDRLNRELCQTLKGEMFVTLGVAILDAKQVSLQYASAGHMAPYLLRGKEMRQLEVSSLPLGIDPDIAYTETMLLLEEGDRIVLYTDGIVESVDELGGFTGFDTFERCLSELVAGLDLEEQINRLVRCMRRPFFQGYEDDRTMVMLKVNGRN